MLSDIPLLWRTTETCEITGHGTLHVVEQEILVPEDLPEPNDLRGRTILLDGRKARVTAVESFMIARPYPPRLPIGIMVSYEQD